MPSASPHSTAVPDAGPPSGRRWHWLLLVVCGLFCHGVLLTNDGVYWDGWFLRAWLVTGNWDTNREFFGAVGMPLYAYVNWAFAWLADPVPAMMVATVCCLVGASVLTYEIGWRSRWLTGEEALAVALLATAFPVFLAAQDIIMFFFIFTHTLFLASVLAALRAMDSSGKSAVAWRMAALVGLFTAGVNAGLLAFQGASFALLFACWQRRQCGSIWANALRFTATHLDYLFMPAATWWFRHTFTPQFGPYANYNQPKFDWIEWRTSYQQFLKGILAHLGHAADWLASMPAVLFLIVALLGVCWFRAPAKWRFQRGPALSRWLFAWGALALVLAILPYVASGKDLGDSGVHSRTGLLLSLPVGFLFFVVLRRALTWREGRHAVLFWPLAIVCVVAFGREYTSSYLKERVRWIQSRALLELLVEAPLVQKSSYVRVLGDESALVWQIAYANYAFTLAEGKPLSRYVTAQYPISRTILPPDQLDRWMIRGSGFPPREFSHFNPAGSQVDVVCKIPPWSGSSFDLTRRYLTALWGDKPQEWHQLRSQLVRLETRVAREEQPLILAPPRQIPSPSAPSLGDFVNGTGMQMVRLPAGQWAGKHEVTQAEYTHLMGNNPSRFQDPARPVESVSWLDAREFCQRLTKTEASAGRLPSGHVYSLPTESFWLELAAGTLLTNGVFNGSYQRWHTAPVGTLPANPQNLHDVRGNVWEWCLDWADSAKHYRLLKGDGWSTERPPVSPLNSSRGMRPDQAFWHTGFRCVLVPERSLPPEFQQPR